MNREKYVFHWEKQNFKPIGNSAHNAECLVLGKILNIYIDYFMFLPKQATGEVKTPSSTSFPFNNDFMMNRELNLCKPLLHKK